MTGLNHQMIELKQIKPSTKLVELVERIRETTIADTTFVRLQERTDGVKTKKAS